MKEISWFSPSTRTAMTTRNVLALLAVVGGPLEGKDLSKMEASTSYGLS